MAEKKKDEQVALNPRNTAGIPPTGRDPKPLDEANDPGQLGEELQQRKAAQDVLKDAADRSA